jgi:MoaA/NifB/PqqE/SkfB family radical SAM enzyme
MKAALYGLKFVVNYYLLRKPLPFIRGLVLTNRCNLRCAHCRIAERGRQYLDFQQVVAAIGAFYREGYALKAAGRFFGGTARGILT